MSTENIGFLLDNGVNLEYLPTSVQLYTTTGIKNEDSKNKNWISLQNINHVLTTYSLGEIKESGGSLVVADTGLYDGTTATITYSTTAEPYFFPNNECSTCTLTSSTGRFTYVISNLSNPDFGLLVYIVAFPYFLVTNENRLGWCSARLGSYFTDPGRGLTKWEI